MGLLSNVKFAAQRLSGRSSGCTHLSEVRDVVRSSDGCEQCLALGDTWVHLRMCLTCGQIGCCDSSKNRHAHRHADETGHPIAQSVERGDDWAWCYVDEILVDVDSPSR
jgi:uncharacterized UBP type Zn finger protein